MHILPGEELKRRLISSSSSREVACEPGGLLCIALFLRSVKDVEEPPESTENFRRAFQIMFVFVCVCVFFFFFWGLPAMRCQTVVLMIDRVCCRARCIATPRHANIFLPT